GIAKQGAARAVQDEVVEPDAQAGLDAAVEGGEAVLQLQGGAVALHEGGHGDDRAGARAGDQLRLVDPQQGAAEGDRQDVADLVDGHRAGVGAVPLQNQAPGAELGDAAARGAGGVGDGAGGRELAHGVGAEQLDADAGDPVELDGAGVDPVGSEVDGPADGVV